MQKTRHRILEYLKERGEASVEELSAWLDDLTLVTVRHHLDVMRSEGLIDPPEIRHRSAPGRPRYIYRLSQSADSVFPKNLGPLTDHLLSQLKETLGDRQVNVIFEGVADRMAGEFSSAAPNETIEHRLDRVVEHLTAQGYMASWVDHPDGYILTTSNCPYSMAAEHPEMCVMDIRYISNLLGLIPHRLTHKLEGDATCSYLIPVLEPGKTT